MTKMIQKQGIDLNISLDGLSICYTDLGKGGVPIIFIHGFPFDKLSWQPQMNFLQRTNRVIAYDIRGFGKSIAKEKKQDSIELYADDLIHFLDALAIDKAIACGLSMGGYIALNAINRYPERFEALILSDTQCIADSPEAKENRQKTMLKLEDGGLDEFTEKFISSVFCSESLTGKKQVVERIKDTILSTSIATLKGGLNALANRKDMCSTVERIAVPTLILCGKEDQVTPTAQAEFLHKNISNSQLQIIDKAGHLPNLEQAEIFNHHLATFISSLTD